MLIRKLHRNATTERMADHRGAANVKDGKEVA